MLFALSIGTYIHQPNNFFIYVHNLPKIWNKESIHF